MTSSQQRQELKAQAHRLRPIVTVGLAGISAPVLAEIDQALEHHELLKVRLNGGSPEERRMQADEISAQTGAALVQLMGRVVTLYRERPAPIARPKKPARRIKRKSPSKSRIP